MSHTWKQGVVALPGVAVSLLPKLVCPMCWPAYAGLLSSVGLGFLISAAYLLPFTAGFLALALAAMGFRANRDRKSTRLNSSHGYISYAVFCLKKKKVKENIPCSCRLLLVGTG